MVREILVPSSSSSSSARNVLAIDKFRVWPLHARLLTNGYWLDLDAFLDVGGGWVIAVFVLQHLFAAEGVDESGPTCAAACEFSLRDGSLHERIGGHTCSRGTAHHQAELDALLDILLAADLYLHISILALWKGRVERLVMEGV